MTDPGRSNQSAKLSPMQLVAEGRVFSSKRVGEPTENSILACTGFGHGEGLLAIKIDTL